MVPCSTKALCGKSTVQLETSALLMLADSGMQLIICIATAATSVCVQVSEATARLHLTCAQVLYKTCCVHYSGVHVLPRKGNSHP